MQNSAKYALLDCDKYILHLTRDAAYKLLQFCDKSKDLEYGRKVQYVLVNNGLESVPVLGDHLIRLFSYHGSLFEANRAFDKISEPSAHSWAAVLSANGKLGQSETSLQLYYRMLSMGAKSDKYISCAILRACAGSKSLLQGRVIHYGMTESGIEHDSALGNSLVDMYAKCWSLEEACNFFYNMPNQDVVSWNTMIAGYVQHGEGSLALHCFHMMQERCIHADDVTFLSTLKACSNIGSLEHGRTMHEEIMKRGLQSVASVSSSLIDMYAKCCSPEESCNVFERSQDRDVVSWNAMVGAYAQNGDGLPALECFEKMEQEGVKQNEVTFLNALKACTSMALIGEGRLIHIKLIKSKLLPSSTLGSALVDMYAKCGSLEEACQVFYMLFNKNVVSWNAMIAGYALHGEYSSALECMERMRLEGIEPNIVSWGAVIAAYAQHGEGCLALECFDKMQATGLKPNEIIIASVLKACAEVGAVDQGKFIHNEIVKGGLQLDVAVGSSLVDMYVKFGCLEEACNIFERLPSRNVISWNVIIAGYTQHEKYVQAIECFEKLQNKDIHPDDLTYLTIIKACSVLGAMEKGKVIHHHIVRSEFASDIVIGSALVNMYAKCGSLEEASKLFKQYPTRDVVFWNAMVTAYAQHGEGALFLECFQRMQQEGVKPDESSFTSILIACSHAGLLDDGHWHFVSMRECYGVSQTILHCNCMVDLLGRAGCLAEAEDLLGIATQTDTSSWMSLLSACRMHGDVAIGRRCFERLVLMGSYCSAVYVLMANIYADIDMQVFMQQS